jgi:small subunit ribosomal protein S13
MSPTTSFRHIIRIAETDIPGNLGLVWGLAKVKGIGYNTAVAICRKLGLNPNMPIGYLSDDEVTQIEEVVKNPKKFGLPLWILNRRSDVETGEDLHLVSSELIYYARRDIEREVKIRSWRGVRHSLGYKVRGQKTHTTGRVGPVVGVQKKKAAQPQQQQQK